jgi:hypothetical protein
MVQGIPERRKTQTRRLVKGEALDLLEEGFLPDFICNPLMGYSQYGYPGDVLWVREKFIHVPNAIIRPYYYAADQDEIMLASYKWKPSIHMPRAAARFFLKITNLRIERLNDITEEDAVAEGYESDGDESAKIWFSMLWDKINGSGAWNANPWVWVIDFEWTIKH